MALIALTSLTWGLPPTPVGPGAYLSSSQGLHLMLECWCRGAGLQPSLILQPSARCPLTWLMAMLIWNLAYRLASWSLSQCCRYGPGCYFTSNQRVQDFFFSREGYNRQRVSSMITIARYRGSVSNDKNMLRSCDVAIGCFRRKRGKNRQLPERPVWFSRTVAFALLPFTCK